MALDRLSARYPILKKPLAIISNAAAIVVWLAIIGTIIWLNNRPPPPLKPLPENIHPPTLDEMTWTVYNRSAKNKTQFSLDLASRQIKNSDTIVWTRFDEFDKRETTLTLTHYDCEFGKRSDIYDVYYEKGAYTGYEEYAKKDEAKVDLETIDGAGFLLACYDKIPSVIDNN